MNSWLTLRGRYHSYQIHRRTIFMILLLLAANAAAIVVCTGLGSTTISPLSVIRTLLGAGESSDFMILFWLRLPRVIIAVMVGAALGVSGALLQGIVRNPLTSPDIIGISGGAALGTVIFILYFSHVSISYMPISSIAGAFAAAFLIYLFAYRKGITPLRLVLIGIGMATALTAVTYMLILTSSFTPTAVAVKAFTFMTGSIYGVSWERDVMTLLPWLAVLLPVSFIYARHLNVQELGDEVATSVGSSVNVKRTILLIISVALAGAAVAIGGTINFIGLMAPHIARKLVGPAYGGVIPVSALIGSLVLLLSDLVARIAFIPLDIPAGVFTAAIGAPFFIYLLYRNRKS
ncbi:putative siderophore transport system permease protein YfhA [Paenibacillus plantiphilus]|uniref:Siderophore transport system permease protein YfhA n=1 Tax=Paenibacillus plantiphilus TaxID=2905650 RepID=A0ABN8FPT3_9BACL|nr:iron ABC transporter permease [Paenibacillus plantiphilus]CAH1190055.1 putative siderophore transport system permease protein YfhA [Paenibacillus plantiphilus]